MRSKLWFTAAGGIIACFTFLNAAQGAAFKFEPALLADTDVVSKLPHAVRDIIRSAAELNESLKTWAPYQQSFKGAGERLGETIRTSFRTIAGLLLAILAWIVELARNVVFWVAGASVILIRWLLETARMIQ